LSDERALLNGKFRKSAPLQNIEAGCGSLCDRVMERTSFRAEVAAAEVQRLFHGAL
jgi:hypothetical protein